MIGVKEERPGTAVRNLERQEWGTDINQKYVWQIAELNPTAEKLHAFTIHLSPVKKP